MTFTSLFALSALDFASTITTSFRCTAVFEQSCNNVEHFFCFCFLKFLHELRDFRVFRMSSAGFRDRRKVHRRPQAFGLFPGSPFRTMLVVPTMLVVMTMMFAVMFERVFKGMLSVMSAMMFFHSMMSVMTVMFFAPATTFVTSASTFSTFAARAS
jgi:hypothetical protein